MLNVLRENFKNTPYLKVVLLAVGLGLVAYLGNYFLGGGGGPGIRWAARVNGVEISLVDFRQEANRIDGRYRQLLGDNYSQFRQPAMIAQEAIESLVAEELVLQDAQRLGLRTTNEEVANILFTNPQFHDPVSGEFIGTERYLDLVGGKTGAAQYEGRISRELLKSRWASLVGQAVTIDDEEIRDEFRKRTEKTAISYVIVRNEDQETAEPEEEALQAWYDDHADDYRRPESRRVRFVVIERDAMLDRVEISEDQIRLRYDENQDRYRHEEQRRARHILFRVASTADDAAKAQARESAEDVLARVQAGEDFAELARSESDDTFSAEKGGDLGYFTRTDMVGPFSEAAFSTAKGELAPVTESPFGFHVIQVTDSRDEGLTPLDEVGAELRRELELEGAQELARTEVARLRGLIGVTGERLGAVAEDEGFVVESRLVVGSESLRDLGASPDFLSAIVEMPPGGLSEPLELAAGMALVTVDEILPPAIAPFEDVRDRVQADLKQDLARSAGEAAADDALRQNADFAAVAESLGLEPKESGDLAPGQSVPGAGGSTPEIDTLLFGESVFIGDRGTISVPAGALVYEIGRREPFDDVRYGDERGDLRAELLNSRRARYGQSVVDQLRQSEAVEVNPTVLGFFN